MTNTNPAANAASKMLTADLIRVSRALESELIADMTRGVVGTQAHVGRLEMLEACGAEISARRSVMLTGEA